MEFYHANIEEINFVMVKYGRTLYRSGKSYNQCAETMNCLVSKKPGLRRLMSAASDLGFSWSKQVRAGLALGFGDLLRSGELVAAKREDLLLPRDIGFAVQFALMSMKEPKSRFTYARHQSTKIGSENLVQLLDFAFGNLKPQ